MGQEAYTQQHSKKTEAKAISFDGNLVISEPSLDVLFEQQRAIVTPVALFVNVTASIFLYASGRWKTILRYSLTI